MSKTYMADPLLNRIFVRPDTPDKVTEAGIIIPQNAVERPTTGTVVAAGPGRYCFETGNIVVPECGVGDRVLYGQHSGIEFELNGEKLLMMTDEEVYAILTEKVLVS